MMLPTQYWWVFAIGLAIRTITILQTSNVDQYLPVKYTDIDYLVFTDAASLLVQGYSPYDRSTYRYSPLLAYLMTPNVTLHEQFGKHFFSCCDIIVAVLIYSLLIHLSTNNIIPYNISPRNAMLYSCFYLFNPLSINLSTRGSMDAIHVALLYGFLLLFYKRCYLASALCYAISIHLRIYPFIFCIPIALTFYMELKQQEERGMKDDETRTNTTRTTTTTTTPETWLAKYKNIITTLCSSVHFVQFVVVVVVANLILLGLFYQQFGFKFLYETYLFHIVRKDTRHNFSPWFYFTYLIRDITNALPVHEQLQVPEQLFLWGSTPRLFFGLISYTTFLNIIKVLKAICTTLPQILILLTCCCLPCTTLMRQHQDNTSHPRPPHHYPLPIVVTILSLFFIATNGVLTAQYFLWFIAFIPLYLPYLFESRTLTTSPPCTTPDVVPPHHVQSKSPAELTPAVVSASRTWVTLLEENKSAVKLLASSLLWFVSELLWLSSGLFVEINGIGGVALVYMCIMSQWLFTVHMFLFTTMHLNVMGDSLESLLCSLRPQPVQQVHTANINTDVIAPPRKEMIVMSKKKKAE